MHWSVLVTVSLFEAFVPLLVIKSESYIQPLYVFLLLITVACSILGLRYAMRAIPLSIAYTVWTALGILGTAVVGAAVLEEILDFVEIACLLLIVIAVAGLRISSVKATS
jgi:multidrug transporter EmrE-like cation transporter